MAAAPQLNITHYSNQSKEPSNESKIKVSPLGPLSPANASVQDHSGGSSPRTLMQLQAQQIMQQQKVLREMQ